MLTTRRSVLLITAGAYASGAGTAPEIHEAAAAGKTERVEQILAQNPASVNQRDAHGATPMHYAAAAGNVAMANLLLSKGAELSVPAAGLDDATPAHLGIAFEVATVAGQLAQALVGNGAAVNIAKADGTTLLHVAVRTGNAPVVRLLLRKGADPKAKDVQGRTARDAAASAVVDLLRKPETVARDCYTGRYRGVKRDDTNGIPQAAINEFVTFAHFNFDKVKQLYSTRPELLLTRSTWDEIAVEAAAHMGREDIGQFFLDKGSPLSLCTATMFGLMSEVKAILAEDPARVRERGAHDFPLLWYTMFGKERPDLTEFLIASGADLHADMMGHTSLELARKKGYERVAEVLVKHGA